jgi:hypothetical protein
MSSSPVKTSQSRLGFHYYPDTNHYQEGDLRKWLPELKSLGAAWLTLFAPTDQAIPETFIRGLLDARVEPILHFHLPFTTTFNNDSLGLLLRSYAKWGIRYVALFDRPNLRSSWSAADWAQDDLVERFIDIYLPLASAVLDAGLQPVFPPLEPGGDYWDTAFLRAALQGIKRRGYDLLLNSLYLGAYAWADKPQLDWGAGGPERWPGARPYLTPPAQQDQRGFFIFDWYLAITEAVLGKPRPIILLGAGSRLTNNQYLQDAHRQRNLSLAKALSVNHVIKPDQTPLDSISTDVLACNFWLLAADPESPYRDQAWYQPDGFTLPIVDALKEMAVETSTAAEKDSTTYLFQPANPSPPSEYGRPISHYLLLPLYEWGIADWHLEVIRPYVAKYHPTIGFSLAEAAHAARVTVVGGQHSFSEEKLDELRDHGCVVQRIDGDGTTIATQLANL